MVVETAQSFRVSSGYGQALNDYECGAESAMDVWLADPAVVKALHVKADTPGMVGRSASATANTITIAAAAAAVAVFF